MDVLPDVRTGVRPHSIHPLKRSATKLGGWTHIACSATSGHASGLCLAHPYFCPDWMRPEASVRAIFVRMRIRHPHQLSGVLEYCGKHGRGASPLCSVMNLGMNSGMSDDPCARMLPVPFAHGHTLTSQRKRWQYCTTRRNHAVSTYRTILQRTEQLWRPFSALRWDARVALFSSALPTSIHRVPLGVRPPIR